MPRFGHGRKLSAQAAKSPQSAGWAQGSTAIRQPTSSHVSRATRPDLHASGRLVGLLGLPQRSIRPGAGQDGNMDRPGVIKRQTISLSQREIARIHIMEQLEIS